MTSLVPVTYEDIRWEPQGRRHAGAAMPRYGTYHAVVPVAADLVLDVPPSVLTEAEAASRRVRGQVPPIKKSLTTTS